MPEEAVALKTQLMKMEETQNQNYNCENISNTPLDELIQEPLKNQDRNQTRLTERKTQFLSDPSGGEYVIISTQTGGACYSKGFKASHKPKTMEKMRFAQ